MAKHIFVFEGPAGAGKSTLINALIADGFFEKHQSMVTIERPRAYSDEDSGATRSLLKDIASLAEAISQVTPLSYLDRGFISQSVYHCLRSGSEAGFAHSLDYEFQLRQLQLSQLISAEYRRRLFRKTPAQSVYFYYVFVLPDVETLLARRSAAPRAFPYPAPEELRLYTLAAEIMSKSLLAPIFIVNETNAYEELKAALQQIVHVEDSHATAI